MAKPDPAIETIKRIADQSPFGGLVICRFCHRETGPGNCQHCGKPVGRTAVTKYDDPRRAKPAPNQETPPA